MLTRLNLVLLVAVVASALALVKTAYDSRRLFAAVHRADAEALRLAGEQRRLEAERELQATNLRVDRTARDKLAMQTITPAITLYADAPIPAPLPASAPTAAASRGASR